MFGRFNQHIGKNLASIIVASSLAFIFQSVPAGAGNDDKSCQPSVPHDLSPSEFEELRDALWETGNARDLKLSFEVNFDFTDYPFLFMLVITKQIDQGKFIHSLINLEVLEILSHRSEFCQYVFINEITSALRYTAIKSLLPKDTLSAGGWNGFGYGALRYFALNDYEKAKCIVLNAAVETLKLDREPTFEEYPRHCVVK